MIKMFPMYKLVSLLLILFIPHVLPAQQDAQLTGTVTGPQQKPVARANLILLRDTVMVKMSVTDDSGRFEFDHIPAGTYSLKITATGFAGYVQHGITVEESQALPAIALTAEDAAELEAVTFRDVKQPVEVYADRIVVNVDNSIGSAGASVMEVLQRAPGVNVDNNDRISLKGNQAAAVWIDGKPSPLQGQDLATVLRGMPAGSVDKIEIITNPGARFDAAGSGGIINIKLKKDKRMGWNGALTGNFGHGKYMKYGAGLNLNYRNKKVNLYANYNYAMRYWFNHLMLDRRFLDTTTAQGGTHLFRYDQDNYALFNFRNHIGNIGIDYYLTGKTILGAAFSLGANKFEPEVNNRSRALGPDDALLYHFNTAGAHDNLYYNYSANVNLRHQFSSSGRSLSADLDYAAFGNRTRQNFRTAYTGPDGSPYLPDYYLKSILDGITSIRSVKADYNHPFSSTWKMDLGLKSSFTVADNNPLFYELENGSYVLDTKRSNHFIYNENINAGYINVHQNIEKWSTQLGVRVENTNAHWEQLTTQQQFNTSYTQLFPSLAAQYHVTGKHDIGLTFSRRIERPNYQQLNPFKFFVDKTTYREGYPYLNPASFYSAELSHTYQQRFITSFVYGINKGFIAEVIQPSETEDSVTVQTNKNMKQMIFAGINGSYSPKITTWWSNVTNFQAYYAHYDGDIAQTPLSKGRPAFNVYTNNTFMLPYDMSMELGLNYRSRELYAYMDVRANWMLNLGLQKHFWDKKATLRLSIQDIFFTGYPRASSEYTGYHEYFVAERETRVATLAFTYRFGSNTVAPVRKRAGGAEEEKGRAQQGA